MHDWMTMIGKYADDNIACLLLGNKSDLKNQSAQREVFYEEGEQVAD